MNSYGKFKDFEIRDVVNLNPDVHYKDKFDLVKWSENGEYCYSIAFLHWDAHEPCFELESVGMRFVENCTPELNKWLLKWCELKSYEILESDNDD